MSFSLIIEPMNGYYNESTRIFLYNSYKEALNAFKERCNSYGYDYDTIDPILYPCEWEAGGIGHDYRISIVVNSLHNYK